MPAVDQVRRRAMLVLELVDPVTRMPVGGAVQARLDGGKEPWITGKGLKPQVSGAGQHVWTYPDPPKGRSVQIDVWATDKRFTRFRDELVIPDWQPGIKPKPKPYLLEPTGLYVPPAGRLAAAGMLVAAAGQPAQPIAKAKVTLLLKGSLSGTTLRSDLAASSDARGGFVAIARWPGDDTPAPAPPTYPDGTVLAWLEIVSGGQTKWSELIAIPRGSLTYVAKPLIWADLRPPQP